MCIRDKNGCFMLVKTLWLFELCSMEVEEALCLYDAILWVSDLQLKNIDFV